VVKYLIFSTVFGFTAVFGLYKVIHLGGLRRRLRSLRTGFFRRLLRVPSEKDEKPVDVNVETLSASWSPSDFSTLPTG